MRRGDALDALNAAYAARGNKPPPLPDQLIALFCDNFRAFRDKTGGEPLAICHDTPGIALKIPALKVALAKAAREVLGATPGRESLSTAMIQVEGLALDAPKIVTWLRVARTPDGHIALDLGRNDGLSAVVWPGGWTLTTAHGVVWRRSGAIDELPVPAGPRTGRVDAAMSLVNITTDDGRALYLACRLNSLIPETTKPVEIFAGQPGTAKTGTTRRTVAWTGGMMAPMSKDPRDFAALAASTQCLGHDNVSALSADRSDLMCRVASGDTWVARELYTDTDVVKVVFQPSVIVLNTIEAGTLRGDLTRRSVVHRLETPAAYLPEHDIAARWEAAHADALGWTLDALAHILTFLYQMPIEEGESMTDFSRMVRAVDVWTGTSAHKLWKTGKSLEYAAMIAGDPVALAIIGYIKDPFWGTPGDLLNRLLLPEERDGVWTPQKLSNRLDRCTMALRELGWQVERQADPHRHTRMIYLVPPGALIIR